MDADFRRLAKELRDKPSSEAADWLLSNYPLDSPDWPRAFRFIEARSWLRDDQVRLAEHYLARTSYAQGWVYDTFLSIMKISVFLHVLRGCIDRYDGNLGLLKYHLPHRLLAACKSDSDRALAAAFLSGLGDPA